MPELPCMGEWRWWGIVWAPFNITPSRKTLKAALLVDYFTSSTDVRWSAVQSGVQSQHRLSHSGRGVTQQHQIHSRCEREGEWRGSKGSRREWKGSMWEYSALTWKGAKNTNSFLFFPLIFFPPRFNFFPSRCSRSFKFQCNKLVLWWLVLLEIDKSGSNKTLFNATRYMWDNIYGLQIDMVSVSWMKLLKKKLFSTGS